MDFLAVMAVLGPFVSAFVAWVIATRVRSDSLAQKKARTTIEEAALAIKTWQDLTHEFEQQVHDVRAQLAQCKASETELRGLIASMDRRISGAAYQLGNDVDYRGIPHPSTQPRPKPRPATPD